MTTTTSYGTWCNRVDPYSTSLEASVEDALGDFAGDYDTDGLVAAYRRAINEALPPSVSLCGDEFIGPWQPEPGEFDDYPHDEYGGLDIRAIIGGVDLWKLAEQFDMTAKDYTADVGEDYAQWLASLDGPTAGAGSSARITHLGGGRVRIPGAAISILRRRGEHDDGVVDEQDGALRIWIGGDGFVLTPEDEASEPVADPPPFASASAWADALDAEMAKTGKTAGDLISEGYADGSLLGVSLNPEAPEADDERGVIVSTNGWVVYYDEQAGYWYSR